MLKQAKRACLAAGKFCGLFELAGDSGRRKSRLLVIGYHGVSLADEHQWRPSLFLSPENFRARMETLKKCGCSVLDLSEALDLLYGGALPERAIVLTFDDGTYDFRRIVWPILKEYGYPATLYLTTYWVTMARPVVPVIWSYLLWKKRGSVYRAPKFLGDRAQLDLTTDSGVSKALEQLVSLANAENLDGMQRDAITQELAEILGADYEDIRARRILHLLQPDEVRELAKDGVSVQMHMHHHINPDEEHDFKRNLNENRTYIQDLVGSSPDHFCYPSGRYKPEFLPWLRELGVKSATTCDPGLAFAKTDPLLVPRLVDTSYLSTLEFESWLVGVGEFLPRRPRR
ncbi:MAG: polysaccharide deacetylase family protein [Terriglobales bacterium]|jgi:peptidoglycan/xylan/chitin deacetylase (PgdA/CDA1 family)